jgi:RHS repeat-associated protein
LPHTSIETANRFEAAGVIFSNTQTVGTLKFINGTFNITSGNVRGPWASGLVVQYTLNGTTKLCERYGIVADNCKATTYYHFGSQRVAMREQTDGNPSGAVYWLHSDHLGSASLTTDADGGKFAELRYKPWGEVRWSSGAMPTDRAWGGMRLESAGYVGSLTDFNARHYSTALARFVSADTIVQDPSDPQTLNRYAFGRNNPLRYVDPTGHCFFQFTLFGIGISLFCPIPDTEITNCFDCEPGDIGGNAGPLCLDCEKGDIGGNSETNCYDCGPNDIVGNLLSNCLDCDPASFGNDGGGQIYDGDPDSFGSPQDKLPKIVAAKKNKQRT